MHQRRDYGQLLNRLNLLGSGAEIGVARGNFSRQILDDWRGRKLYLIDPWCHQPSRDYWDISNVTDQQHEENFRVTLQNLLPHADRTTVMREKSENAAENFADESLDFAYIDANHGYDQVHKDLTLWYPKIVPSGLFAGHDFLNGYRHGSFFGVQEATELFAAEHDLDISLTNEEWPTWFCVKPAQDGCGVANRRADICFLTAHDETQRRLGEISVPNKRQYCTIQGYTFAVETDSFDESRPAAWSKIRFISKHLEKHDWVFWSDVDSIITNPSIRLEKFLDSAFDILVTKEDIGVGFAKVNNGNLFIRRTAWSMKFLELLYDQAQFINHPWWDNAAFNHLLETKKLSEHVKIVPQRQFNSYIANHWSGDFMLHLALKQA